MLLLVTSSLIFFLKTTKKTMAWKVYSSLCLCPAFFSELDTFILLQAQNLSTGNSCLFWKVINVITIILIAPATHATLERSFLALESFKISTFFTMKDSKLNHLPIILIDKKQLDEINIKLIKNKFIKE